MLRLPFKLPEDLPLAAAAVREVLHGHGVFCMPTETFYALAADPADPIAVARVLELKGRPMEKALPVVAADLDQVTSLVLLPEPWRARLVDAWPAPLTAVLEARTPVPAGGGTLGVRVPSHALLRALLARVGPLTSTSANLSGASPSAEPATVADAFGEGLSLLLDGGTAPGGPPSTVLDCTCEPALVLRLGAWLPPSEWGVKTV